jgi:hypothetical protein
MVEFAVKMMGYNSVNDRISQEFKPLEIDVNPFFVFVIDRAVGKSGLV